MTKSLVVLAILVSVATFATSSMLLQGRVATQTAGGAIALTSPASSSATSNNPQISQVTTSVQTITTSTRSAPTPQLFGQPGAGQSLPSCLPVALADQPISQQLGNYNASGYCGTIRGFTPLGK